MRTEFLTFFGCFESQRAEKAIRYSQAMKEQPRSPGVKSCQVLCQDQSSNIFVVLQNQVKLGQCRNYKPMNVRTLCQKLVYPLSNKPEPDANRFCSAELVNCSF